MEWRECDSPVGVGVACMHVSERLCAVRRVLLWFPLEFLCDGGGIANKTTGLQEAAAERAGHNKSPRERTKRSEGREEKKGTSKMITKVFDAMKITESAKTDVKAAVLAFVASLAGQVDQADQADDATARQCVALLQTVLTIVASLGVELVEAVTAVEDADVVVGEALALRKQASVGAAQNYEQVEMLMAKIVDLESKNDRLRTEVLTLKAQETNNTQEAQVAPTAPTAVTRAEALAVTHACEDPEAMLLANFGADWAESPTPSWIFPTSASMSASASDAASHTKVSSPKMEMEDMKVEMEDMKVERDVKTDPTVCDADGSVKSDVQGAVGTKRAEALVVTLACEDPEAMLLANFGADWAESPTPSWIFPTSASAPASMSAAASVPVKENKTALRPTSIQVGERPSKGEPNRARARVLPRRLVNPSGLSCSQAATSITSNVSERTQACATNPTQPPSRPSTVGRPGQKPAKQTRFVAQKADLNNGVVPDPVGLSSTKAKTARSVPTRTNTVKSKRPMTAKVAPIKPRWV